MMRLFRRLFLFLFIVFLLPALVSLIAWQADTDRPRSWHSANWSSAQILPAASKQKDAVIYVMAARTGSWKGAFSVHSWIVTKRNGEQTYNRYDKVGWGSPIRRNAYAADANWYSNPPKILRVIRGEQASKLIPKIEAAVENYPYMQRGGYTVWPGPNSNSFVAHVLNEVPEMGLVLPANAVGRDFYGENRFVRIDPDWLNIQVSLNGFLGFAFGKRSGFELHFFSLVTGLDFSKPGLKLPGFGTISI